MSKFDFVTPDGYKPMREVRAELLDLEGSKGKLFSEQEVDAILEMFWFRDSYSSFIALEHVYPDFIEFLRKQKGKPFERVDFYNSYFSGFTIWDQIMTLSFEAEKRMSGEFTLDEFLQLEKKLSLSREALVEWKIIKVSNGVVSFVHHTISEYFVATDLLEEENIVEKFDTLASLELDKTKEKFFNPSWYGVALFLLQSDRALDIAKYFVDLADQNSKIIDQNYAEVLSHSKLPLLGSQLKKRLFDQIYINAKESGIWISEWSVSGLVSLFSNENLGTLESDLVEEPTDFSDVVSTSNVVAIMGELIQENKVEDKDVLTRWKEIFIKYSNQTSGNGVLQRRSLKALESFHEEEIIERVKSVFDFAGTGVKEQFVQEAFLRLCYETAPNSNTTIDYICLSFSSEARAYSWFGLQKITDPSSLLYFLQKLTEDNKLLETFLEDAAIFLRPDDDEEKIFIKSIRSAFKSEKRNDLLRVSSILIQKASNEKIYYLVQGKSFVPTLLKIAFENKKDFWIDLFSGEQEDETSENHIRLIYFLCLVTNSTNYLGIFEYFQKEKPELLEDFVYRVRDLDLKNELLTKIGKPEIPPMIPDNSRAEASQRIKDTLEGKLNPAPNQYITDVFEFYMRHHEEIGELDEATKKRLLYLAYEDGIHRLDPTDFTIKINRYGDSKNFSWSRQAQFYGDMIRVVQKLEPELLNNCRQHLIDFVPFAFSDDLVTILDIVESVNDQDITKLNSACLDPENGRRYLIPSSYIQFVQHFRKKGCGITTPKEVLRSFIGDEKISAYDQNSALEALELFIDQNDPEYFEFLRKLEEGSDKSLAKTANSALIKKYYDPKSIQWRFLEIKNLALPVEPHKSGESFEITFPEDQFWGTSFAQPLLSINDPKLATQFLDLLDHAFDFSKKKNSEAYLEYVNKIVLAYFEGIASQENYHLFEALEKRVNDAASVYWKYYLPQLRIRFLSKGQTNG